jgi:hypothetical protein
VADRLRLWSKAEFLKATLGSFAAFRNLYFSEAIDVKAITAAEAHPGTLSAAVGIFQTNLPECLAFL